ncbi:MAG: hypothetical protein PUP92_27990 [Rhizonema sp. PD38]|nr:hypothetical protein [Rhizonema sp. PD38]
MKIPILHLEVRNMGYYKPPAYWNNASRKFFRPLIGDRATALLHYAIGAGLIAIGIIVLGTR